MKDLPFINTDAGVTALMGLVTVMTTEVLHNAVARDSDFIDRKDTKTFATKTFVCILVYTPTSLGKTILT